ncbi:hypothetical protein SAMN05660691_00899 [Rheinheimera pacifica]|uniref:Uncharacterized protein n=1 Tax=Rheinheimera pacifica TaxID=173990 RepID=A0A1H6K0S5_9GAMM|nr:hypothetical protein [Rheinheimera pacifica]SEH68551.1 hypothetical protein SAMN05660691_00899 [Rheinheimera pacifica]
MQINGNMFNTMTDWLSDGTAQSDNNADFMQTLNSALDPNSENAEQQVNQLVSMLSGQSDTTAMSGPDAMFAALTQNMMQSMVQAALEPTPEQAAAAAAELADPTPTAFADGNAPGLADALDIINPLQHIPLVSQYYRDWTGDDMGYISQVAGGAFWGGGVGVATSFVNLGLTSVMGKSPSQYIQQLFAADDVADVSTGNTATAAKTPATVRPASS